MPKEKELNYVSLLEMQVKKINWKKPTLFDLEKLNFIAERITAEDFKDLKIIPKLENILETMGNSWPLVPAAKTIAEKLYKHTQNMSYDYIGYFIAGDDSTWILGTKAAYLIAKSAVIRKKYFSDAQKQK